MKNLYLILILFAVSNNTNAQDYWIPFSGYHQTTVVQNYTINPVPQPVLVYRLVPVLVNQNTVTEQYCLFRKTQTIIVQPTIQWIYQPVLIYR